MALVASHSSLLLGSVNDIFQSFLAKAQLVGQCSVTVVFAVKRKEGKGKGKQPHSSVDSVTFLCVLCPALNCITQKGTHKSTYNKYASSQCKTMRQHFHPLNFPTLVVLLRFYITSNHDLVYSKLIFSLSVQFYSLFVLQGFPVGVLYFIPFPYNTLVRV